MHDIKIFILILIDKHEIGWLDTPSCKGGQVKVHQNLPTSSDSNLAHLRLLHLTSQFDPKGACKVIGTVSIVSG